MLATIGESHGGGKWKTKVLVNDRIADSIFQQIILRPEDYSVLATTNLNGRLHLGRLLRRRSAAWASPPAATSATATRSSRRRMARLRSMRTKMLSIRVP